MKNKSAHIMIIIAACGLVFSLNAVSQEKTEEVNFNAPVGNRPSLELSGLSGDVKISGWDRQEISIKAVKRGEGKNVARLMQLINVDIEQRGDKVECEVHYPSKSDMRKGGFDKSTSVSIDFTIKVPYSCRLSDISLVSGHMEISDINSQIEAEVVSGNIRGSNIGGEIELNSVTGTITLDGVHGELEITSTSSDIVLKNVTGNLEVSSTSGSITVEAIDLESLEAQTTSGDISMSVVSPITFGEFSFRVLSGNIDIQLPQGSIFELSGETASGDISSEYELRQKKSLRKKTISGVVGDENGAEIEVSTFNGNIVIRR